MSEAGKYELLTEEEERALFERMHSWSKSEKCAPKIKKLGEEARLKLIKSNLRLVIKIAKEFRNVGLDYEDLISEGNLGLAHAVDKFSLEKGAKLSYYASFWIKQGIRRAISNKGRTVRLPVAVVEAKLKVSKYIENHEGADDEEPSDTEISLATGLPLKTVKKVRALAFQAESLNREVTEGTELGNLMKDICSPVPSKVMEIKDERDLLGNFLGALDYRQRYIIIHRFGLNGSKPQTLEVIGKEFDLTRERIRQLELAALNNLKDMYKKIERKKYIE